MKQGLVVIAGATSLIGRKTAAEFSRLYSRLLLLGGKAAALGELQETLADSGSNITTQSLDLHSPSELWRVVERERGILGQAAVLICVGADRTAGLASQLSFEQFEPETISSCCTEQLIKYLLPAMIRRRFGRIVLLAPDMSVRELPESGNASNQPLGGLLQACGSLAKQTGRSRITINAIAAAHTDAEPALDSMSRQLRYLGISRPETMRFLCRCEQTAGSDYSRLIPRIAVGLAAGEAEFINGMCFVLPLQVVQSAA